MINTSRPANTSAWATCLVLALSVPLWAWPIAAGAQTDTETETETEVLLKETFVDDLFVEDEIIVTGTRQQFSSVDNITPDVQFGTGDIRALGTTDIGELIEAINAEIGSDSSEPPIILLNGRPVQSRRQIRSFPSEAIRRVDVLPPDASLKFSSSPNRRVLNFVLRNRFNALTAELEGGTSTEGGRHSGEASANYLKIINEMRLSLDLSYEIASNLGETERDISFSDDDGPFSFAGTLTAPDGASELDSGLSRLAGEPVFSALIPRPLSSNVLSVEDFLPSANQTAPVDTRLYRDLLPETEAISIGGSYFRPVGERLSVTAGFNTDFTQSNSRRGLISSNFLIPSDNSFSPFGNDVSLFRLGDPIIQENDTSDVGATLSVFGDYPGWRWSLESAYSKATGKTETNRALTADGLQDAILANDPDLNPFAKFSLSELSLSEREQENFNIKGRVNGTLFALPAGDMTGSVGLEYTKTDLESMTRFETAQTDIYLSRQVTELSGETNIPLLGSAGGRDERAGNVSLRLNGALKDVEAVGTLESYGTGLRWDVSNNLSLEGSVDQTQNAPSLSNIGNPIIVENNVRFTDFDTGNAVFIDRITGGNPTLLPEEQRDFRITARYSPSRELQFNTRYLSRKTENSITSFPFLTPQLAEAFPDRLARDAFGNLVSLDARPVNAYQVDEESLRTGFNWRKRFGSSQEGEGNNSSRRGDGPPNRGSGGPRSGERGGDGNSTQLGLSIYHTLRLTDEFRFSEDGPVFNLLNGGGFGQQGGEPEHEIETRVSLRHKNMGGRLSLAYQSGTELSAGSSDLGTLQFAPLTTADLRLYYDLGRTSEGRPVSRDSWRRNLRFSIDIDNITNSKQSVFDVAGQVPFGYEEDALDPLGRTVMFSIRKLFSTAPERRGRG